MVDNIGTLTVQLRKIGGFHLVGIRLKSIEFTFGNVQLSNIGSKLVFLTFYRGHYTPMLQRLPSDLEIASSYLCDTLAIFNAQICVQMQSFKLKHIL